MRKFRRIQAKAAAKRLGLRLDTVWKHMQKGRKAVDKTEKPSEEICS